MKDPKSMRSLDEAVELSEWLEDFFSGFTLKLK